MMEVKSGRKSIVKLEIKDTIAPVAEITIVDIYESRAVEPHEFIKSVDDATDVTATYKTEPDYSRTGSQEVFLILEDTSGNISEYQSILRISKVKRIAEVDISAGKLDAGIFLKNEKDLINSDVVETPFPETLGIFPVRIKVGDTIFDSSLTCGQNRTFRQSCKQKFWTVDKISAMVLLRNC